MSPIHASPSPAAAPHAATAPSAPTDALLATLDAWTDAGLLRQLRCVAGVGGGGAGVAVVAATDP